MFGPHWKDLSSPMPVPPEAKQKVEGTGETEGVADLVNPAHYGEAALKGIFGQVSEDLGKVTREVDRRAGKKKKKAEPEPIDEPPPLPPPPQVIYKMRPTLLNFKKLLPWYMRKEAKVAALIAGGAAGALVLARLIRR